LSWKARFRSPERAASIADRRVALSEPIKLGEKTPVWTTSVVGGVGSAEVGGPLWSGRPDGDRGASATVGGGGPTGAGVNLWLSVASLRDTGGDPGAEGGMEAGGVAGGAMAAVGAGWGTCAGRLE
jgi:hypothetical protein